jgi:DNA helicase-2/ATP-dependent DNA helicase PcrA
LNIYFNSAADLRDIFNKFDNICCTNGLSEKHNRFYLAKGNKIVNQIHQSFGISLLSKDDRCSKNILSEALRYITGVLGKSRKEICEAKKLSTMDLRKYGMKVLRKIKDNPMIDEAEFQQFIATLFGLPISKEHKMKDSFNKMIAFNNDPKESYKHCSTIHKAKGLEAHAVLVIAETKAELLKWFETDHQRRCADKLDTCREGFVAFSRAKELLCIACLEKLDSSALETIQRLGIESI